MPPKNIPLEYTAPEPSFLRALRAGQTGFNASPQQVRPKKNLLRGGANGENEDDAPVYVDAESGEVIGKEVYEGMNKEGKDMGDGEGEVEANEKNEGEVKHPLPQQVVEVVGAAKKRKAIKVVGGEEEEAEARATETTAKKSSKANGITESIREDEVGTESKPKTKTKSKDAKKKKIKLSFDDD